MIINMAKHTADRRPRSKNVGVAARGRSRTPRTGVKLVSIGTSTGAIFPKEMLAQLKVKKGDTLFAVETPGGILLTPYDPEVETQLEAGRAFMREYRDTFRALAK
jgi:putative addiction module antidote